MTYFYHIADPVAYRDSKMTRHYRHSSLDKEGFIHCSMGDQVEGTANFYFATEKEIRILKIARELVEPEVVFEGAKRGGLFPHIFGPLNLSSVVGELILEKSGDGLFRFHEDLMKD